MRYVVWKLHFPSQRFFYQVILGLLDKKIFEMENVIFTPHNAFNSKEAIERILTTTCDNVKEFKHKGEVKFNILK